MSTGKGLKRGPQQPQRSVARLDSIKNPQPRPIPQIKRPRARECPNPECAQKDTGIEEDGKSICSACGTVIEELNMVSEVAYGLSSGGQHVVHGFHVGADQAYANRGDVVDRDRSMTSRDVTIASGQRYITQIGTALGMNESLRDMGMHVYRLAVGGFIQGRRIKSVAAVALYIACRTQKDSNSHMLIDFADVLEIDVFSLGQVYKLLLDHIRLNGTGLVVQPLNPEDLILRFCKRLEFGSETMRVARDAVRIVQRMNRDWMTPGRRPAGVCGAALFLAAQMSNFRRSVREIVYVVKVQEQTIFKRLEEFRVTESSGLTVEQFRSIDLERFADPPIFTAQREGKDGKKKRVRKRRHEDFDDDGDNDQPTVISSRASSNAPSAVKDLAGSSSNSQQQARADSRSMPPPPLPIDPSILEESAQPSLEGTRTTYSTSEGQSNENLNTPGPPSTNPSTAPSTKSTSEPPTKRKRGRPPKQRPDDLTTPPATHSTTEPALEADITMALTDPSNIDHANALTSVLEAATEPPSSSATKSQRPSIPDTKEISESEFADDPEVSNCLLSPDEVAIKTRIWTHENREYLRTQTAKLVRQQLAEENGTARVIVRRKRRRARMGDMSAYLGEDGEEGGPVAGSPAEAVMQMMSRRTYSKKLNYDMIKSIYGGSSSGGTTPQGSVSLAGQSPRSGGDAMAGANDASRAEEVTAVESGEEAEKNAAGDGAADEQQKELESIAGEFEQGMNDEDDEDEGEGQEDDYDDDPFEGGHLSE